MCIHTQLAQTERNSSLRSRRRRTQNSAKSARPLVDAGVDLVRTITIGVVQLIWLLNLQRMAGASEEARIDKRIELTHFLYP